MALGFVVATALVAGGLFYFSAARSGVASSSNSLRANGGTGSGFMPTKFHTVVQLEMPYIGIVEPLEVWTDLEAGLQHINYWGPLNQFYLNRTGAGCQIVPVSFDGATSEEVRE